MRDFFPKHSAILLQLSSLTFSAGGWPKVSEHDAASTRTSGTQSKCGCAQSSTGNFFFDFCSPSWHNSPIHYCACLSQGSKGDRGFPVRLFSFKSRMTKLSDLETQWFLTLVSVTTNFTSNLCLFWTGLSGGFDILTWITPCLLLPPRICWPSPFTLLHACMIPLR